MKIVSVTPIPTATDSREYMMAIDQAELDALTRMTGQATIDPTAAVGIEIQFNDFNGDPLL